MSDTGLRDQGSLASRKSSSSDGDGGDDLGLAMTDGGLLSPITSGLAVRDKRHTPMGILAGVIPHLPGKEDEMVWQAASDACGTERVHFNWSANSGKVWYIATPSATLAAAPNSWCSFAAVLPGNPRSRPEPTCYIEVEDGLATLMAHYPGGIEIHQGDLPIINAKAESIARRIGRGGAPAQVIKMETIQRLNRISWRSMSLIEDRLRRFIAGLAFLVGISIAAIAGLTWGVATLIHGSNVKTGDVLKRETDAAIKKLASQADDLSRSQISADLQKFMDLDRTLVRYGGVLRRFEIRHGVAHWVALLPQSLSPQQISEIGGRVSGTEGRYVLVEGGGAR